MLNQYTRNFKVLVVGDILTGKQSFVKRYVNNIWHPLYKPTIGVDFALKTIQWAQNTTIRLQIWLIAGQERFSSMTRVYYKGADACVVLFDLERQTTLDGAIKWKKDLDSKYKLHSRKPVPCILVGNKSDLPDRPVDKEIIDKLCKEHSFLCWTEMSVKEDINVKKPMEYLVKHLMEDGKEGNKKLFILGNPGVFS
ncbi:predicted protein [Nematostella vectensis]|uniref:Ras-related protein Rab n=1 Tax=Nematostella vectensis TaxID=45351 RepID=A7RR62_NEMVE|nr:predicted protein [Nematostella vectensis]|eukprot:XP_001638120.1 predicted protein [Nematostella vectensis]